MLDRLIVEPIYRINDQTNQRLNNKYGRAIISTNNGGTFSTR